MPKKSTTVHNYSSLFFLNKTSGQTVQTKTQNPLYYGTEGVVHQLKNDAFQHLLSLRVT
jgi:hypothetical protein